MKLKGHYILDVYSAYKDKLDVPDMLIIESIMEALNYRMAQVINRRFYENATLREIGDEFSVVPERIRQLESRFLRDLRFGKNRIAMRALRGY